MEKNTNQEERILKYIKGQMENDERAAFEKECALDSSLSKEVEYYKDIAAAVFHEAAEREYAMRELLKKTEEDILSEKKKVVKVVFGPIREPLREAAITGDDTDVDAGDWLTKETEKNKKPLAADKIHFRFSISFAIILIIVLLLIVLLLTH